VQRAVLDGGRAIRMQDCRREAAASVPIAHDFFPPALPPTTLKKADKKPVGHPPNGFRVPRPAFPGWSGPRFSWIC
jgi:hypothetical protein